MIKIVDDIDNKRFVEIVARQFIHNYVNYGEIPPYIDFYRSCKFIHKNNDNYIYHYPVSNEEVEQYTLYCPERFVKKALSLHHDIEILKKEFEQFINKKVQ